MPDFLGRSVYLTEFEKQKAPLAAHPAGGAPVFISLHIGEEFGPDYPARVRAMCGWLRQQGWRILADVSELTARQFGCSCLYADRAVCRVIQIQSDGTFSFLRHINRNVSGSFG